MVCKRASPPRYGYTGSVLGGPRRRGTGARGWQHFVLAVRAKASNTQLAMQKYTLDPVAIGKLQDGR